MPAVVAPSAQDKAKLLTLGKDIVDAWYTGTPGSTEEYWDQSTRQWQWNSTEAGGASNTDVATMGLSSLSAAVARYYTPYDFVSRRRYRKAAMDSVDHFWDIHQDPVTGGIYRADVANVAGDSGTATFFALAQIGLVIGLLDGVPNIKTRWSTQILRAVDYTTSRGEETYYTNGNFMLLKLVAYDLAARVSNEDATRRAKVESLWNFTYYPSTADPTKWKGCGWHDAGLGNGSGYFSEVTNTGSGVDHSAESTFDVIYTQAQSNYACIGYLLSGDSRFLTASHNTIKTVFPYASKATNQTTQTDGSRHAGQSVDDIKTPSVPLGSFLSPDGDISGWWDTYLNNATQGLDVDLRRYLSVTNSTIVRIFGLNCAAAIVAAHGVCLT